MVMKLTEPDQIAAIELAIEMHKSGKTIQWISRTMKTILKDEKNKQLDALFLRSQFAIFKYDYKRTEAGRKWTQLHKRQDIKLDQELGRRYERLEHHFLDKWSDDTPETAAKDDGFPDGWSKLIGGDEEYYDIYIDRYSKSGLVTVWKDRGAFWWWGTTDGITKQQMLSKQEAIESAEDWLKKLAAK